MKKNKLISIKRNVNKSGYISSGFFIFKSKIFDKFKKIKNSNFEQDIIPKITELGNEIYCHKVNKPFIDIGIKKDLKNQNFLLKKNIMSLLKNCRICFEKKLIELIDLGNQPWCNNFLKKEEIGKEKFYPLKVVLCDNCKISQLNYTVPKEVMFSDHTYLSGVTRSLSKHFENLRDEIIDKFNIVSKKKILDLGSNDGTFLKHFKNIGWHTLGVEPSKRVSEIANQNNIKTINRFFNFEISEEINEKFDFINASGVFFHLEELHSFTKGVRNLLSEDGVFIVQFLYMKSIMENIAFDQIYHEHLLYYNLSTLNNLLKQYDLEIFDAKLHKIHGGQMTAYIGKKNKHKKTQQLEDYEKNELIEKVNEFETYMIFKKEVELLKLEIKNLLIILYLKIK